VNPTPSNTPLRSDLQCYPSALENTSRVRKTIDSLIDLGLVDRVYFWGTTPKTPDNTYEGQPQKVFLQSKLPSGYRPKMRESYAQFFAVSVALIGYYLGIIGQAIWLKPDFITCRKVDLLPFGLVAKWLCGKKTRLIYAPHELESEKTGLSNWVKKAFKIIEKGCLPFVHHTIVVCEPIADWYKATYQIESISVVRNIPKIAAAPVIPVPLKALFGIPPESTLFIYQGILAEARGTKLLLEVFSSAPADKHLVMMGFGVLQAAVEQMAHVHPNIHFLPGVPVDQIIAHTAGADVGIFVTEKDYSLSYRYSLPNKFHEYLLAGLPIITSPTLEYIAGLIEKNSLGWVVSSDAGGMETFVRNFRKEDISVKTEHIKKFRANLDWKNEEQSFIKAYSG